MIKSFGFRYFLFVWKKPLLFVQRAYSIQTKVHSNTLNDTFSWTSSLSILSRNTSFLSSSLFFSNSQLLNYCLIHFHQSLTQVRARIQQEFHLQQELSLLNFPCLYYVSFPSLSRFLCLFHMSLSRFLSHFPWVLPN